MEQPTAKEYALSRVVKEFRNLVTTCSDEDDSTVILDKDAYYKACDALLRLEERWPTNG